MKYFVIKTYLGYTKMHGFNGNPKCDSQECGCTYKVNNISAVTEPILLNLVPD